MFLTNDPTKQLDTRHLESPRQRNSFHLSQVSPGKAFSCTWKQDLYTSTGTGGTWLHLIQAFSVSENDLLVTLDAEGGILRIEDYVRGFSGCPTTSLAGTTITHHISPSVVDSSKITNHQSLRSDPS
ncbi:hypothetical protein K438DRAFT_1968539 [Mycena galopus ATCC 62051]|nr:hypothetical protein K438DRAFT_1968539 [Mycena galopus ATCC 62051]